MILKFSIGNSAGAFLNFSFAYLMLYYLILYDDIKLVMYLYYKYKTPTELIKQKDDTILTKPTSF